MAKDKDHTASESKQGRHCSLVTVHPKSLLCTDYTRKCMEYITIMNVPLTCYFRKDHENGL